MGVFSVGDRVVGISGSTIDLIMDYGIQKVGEKSYMAEAKFNFANGYNFIDLADYSRADIVEFYQLVGEYLSSRDYERIGATELWKQELKQVFQRIRSCIEEHALAEWGQDIRGLR
jgi:hypothetical protein